MHCVAIPLDCALRIVRSREQLDTPMLHDVRENKTLSNVKYAVDVEASQA